MLQKSITYTDFNGNEVTEDFFFHLNKSDLIKMEMSIPGGLEAHLQQIVADENGREIMRVMDDLIDKSIGEKSTDGKRFIKSDEITQKFKSSPAHDELFTELCTSAEFAAQFVEGIIPKGLDNDPQLQRARQAAASGHPSDPAATPAPPAPSTPDAPQQLGTDAAGPRRLTRQEMSGMDSAELSHLLATGQAVIGEE